MAFFELIPLYWFSSMMIYAASPRQNFIQHQHVRQSVVSVFVGWLCFFVVNIASFAWLTWQGWSPIVVSITLLLINMLMVPSCIILIAHKPHWLKPCTLLLIAITVIAQFISQGQRYVA